MRILAEFDQELLELERQEELILDRVYEPLQLIREQRWLVLQKREAAQTEFLLKSIPNALLEKKSAEELYAVGYDEGRGSGAFNQLYEVLVRGTYFLDSPFWWILNGERKPVKAPMIFIDERLDAQKLSRTITLAKPLYETALSINYTVPLELSLHGENSRIVPRGDGKLSFDSSESRSFPRRELSVMLKSHIINSCP